MPKGHDKFTGLKYVSDRLRTIGIADSLNDLNMLLGVDCAFTPANASFKLVGTLKKEKDIVTIKNLNIHHKNIILKSRYNNTRGVVEILKFINNNLR